MARRKTQKKARLSEARKIEKAQKSREDYDRQLSDTLKSEGVSVAKSPPASQMGGEAGSPSSPRKPKNAPKETDVDIESKPKEKEQTDNPKAGNEPDQGALPPAGANEQGMEDYVPQAADQDQTPNDQAESDSTPPEGEAEPTPGEGEPTDVDESDGSADADDRAAAEEPETEAAEENAPEAGEGAEKVAKAGAAAKAGSEAVEQAKKRGAKELAKAAKVAAKNAARAAGTWLAGVLGWPVIIGCGVAALIFIIIILAVAANSVRNGAGGKTPPQQAGTNDPNVQKLITAASTNATAAKGAGGLSKTQLKKLEFANLEDLEFVKAGKIDKRLAAALAYLVDHHDHIRISHIISGYQNLSVNPESGRFHDIQMANNISAHKDGLAADIDEIDYIPEKCECGQNIPVKIVWQTLGDDPNKAAASDALGKIKSSADLINPDVKNALEKLGVTGLDKPEVQAALKNGGGALGSIKSVTDLLKPEVIGALSAVGVGGVDNSQLQNALKQLQAIQSLTELTVGDLNALKNNQAAKDLFAGLGIGLDDTTINQLIELQNAQLLLANIDSLSDLTNPANAATLAALGININDPNIQQALAYLQNAGTVTNFQGDFNSTTFTDALKALGYDLNANNLQAAQIFSAGRNLLGLPASGIVSDPQTIALLGQLGIDISNPTAQNVVDQVRAAYNILNWTGAPASANLADYLTVLGIPATTENLQAVLQGQFGSLGNLSAWQSVFSAANIGGLQSGAAAAALSQLGFADQAALISQLTSLSKIINPAGLTSAGLAGIAEAAANFGLSVDVTAALDTFGSLSALGQIHSVADLANPMISAALKDLGLPTNISGALGPAGALMTLSQIQSPADLLKPANLAALSSLGFGALSQELLGQFAGLQSLLTISSFSDLLNPSSLLALNNLGLLSLSNPVMAALTALSFVDNLTGGNLLGGVLGGKKCKATTDCYKEAAQKNIYSVVENLLQMPYDLKNPDFYRVTQLITYDLSYIQSKDPELSSKLDKLYWVGRAANVGLFTMPEAIANIHIGY